MGRSENPWGLIRQQPELVGSPDPPTNKVAAWAGVHAEVKGLVGTGPLAAFLPMASWGQCHSQRALTGGFGVLASVSCEERSPSWPVQTLAP